MFGKSKNTLFYAFTENNEEYENSGTINEILELAKPSTSCWWSKMSKTIAEVKTDSYAKYVSAVHKNALSGGVAGKDITDHMEVASSIGTGKVCPAIIQTLANSYLVKAPCDIYVTVDRAGSFSWRVDSDIVRVDNHPASQFTPEDSSADLFAGHVNVKFTIEVLLQTNKVPWLFLQPMYHNNHSFKVINGLVSGDYTRKQGLAVNTLLEIPKDKDFEAYHIEKGSVLCYLYFPHKMKLKHTKDNVFLGAFKKRN